MHSEGSSYPEFQIRATKTKQPDKVIELGKTHLELQGLGFPWPGSHRALSNHHGIRVRSSPRGVSLTELVGGEAME